MKISELQEILNHYKQENGDLEVRIVIGTPLTQVTDILTSNDIKLSLTYDTDSFIKAMKPGLLVDKIIANLKERGLAVNYLNIYKYIEQ